MGNRITREDIFGPEIKHTEHEADFMTFASWYTKVNSCRDHETAYCVRVPLGRYSELTEEEVEERYIEEVLEKFNGK